MNKNKNSSTNTSSRAGLKSSVSIKNSCGNCSNCSNCGRNCSGSASR